MEVDEDKLHGKSAKPRQGSFWMSSSLRSAPFAAPLSILLALATLAWLSSNERTPRSVDVLSAESAYRPETVDSAEPGGKLLYATTQGSFGKWARISYWHDIPLYPSLEALGAGQAAAGVTRSARAHATAAGQATAPGQATLYPRIVNMVCEIPAGSRPKMEIQKELPGNPIKQDVNGKGKPRSYGWPSLVNYGALPRTYEHPALADHATGLGGDGDPVDVMELVTVRPARDGIHADGTEVSDDDDAGQGRGSLQRDTRLGGPCTPGEVYPVRILGAVAMLDKGSGSSSAEGSTGVDAGETDWKLLVVRVGGELDSGLASQDLSDAVPVADLAGHFRRLQDATADASASNTVNSSDNRNTTGLARLLASHSAELAPPTELPYEVTAVSSLERLLASDSEYDDPVYGPGAKRPPPSPSASPVVWRAWLAGRLRDLHLWLRDYKLAEGKPPNAFAWGGAAIGSHDAAAVAAAHYEHWCGLLWALSQQERGLASSPTRDSEGPIKRLLSHGLDHNAGLEPGAPARLLASECRGFDPAAEA